MGPKIWHLVPWDLVCKDMEQVTALNEFKANNMKDYI